MARVLKPKPVPPGIVFPRISHIFAQLGALERSIVLVSAS